MQQRLAQHCKSTILQLNKKMANKKREKDFLILPTERTEKQWHPSGSGSIWILMSKYNCRVKIGFLGETGDFRCGTGKLQDDHGTVSKRVLIHR